MPRPAHFLLRHGPIEATVGDPSSVQMHLNQVEEASELREDETVKVDVSAEVREITKGPLTTCYRGHTA